MLTRSDRAVFVGIAVYTLFLAALPLALPPAQFKWWVAETGPLENLSIASWLVAAIVVAARIRPFTARSLAFVVVFALFAAREADLHKAFTAQGIFKLDYYRSAAAPLLEKTIGGAVALLFIGLVAYLLIAVSARFLLRQGGLKSRSGMWLAIAWGLLVFTKIVDRSKVVLARLFDVSLPPEIDLVVPAFEEGGELLVPLLFIVSIWISQNERRYLS